MKDFNSFLEIVDISKIKDATNLLPESQNIFEYQQSLNVSVMIELLRQYHEWLISQLPQQHS